MTRSPIEWTQETWNPIVGCSILSPGCIHCYAMPLAHRIAAMSREVIASGRGAGQPHYHGLTKVVNGKPVWTGEMRLAAHKLTEPLRRRKPTMYFVNSMSDLFHENVPDAWIDQVFAVMALTPQHTYQVLTKRSARMRRYIAECGRLLGRQHEIRAAMRALAPDTLERTIAIAAVSGVAQWKPLPNVWLGVSTEDQTRASERIPNLLATPAAVRFISAEPLLGAISLANSLVAWSCHECFDGRTRTSGHFFDDQCPSCGGSGCEKPRLDWVIVGGESGRNARPMHPDWARGLRDQCTKAGVPFFFKQWGEWQVQHDRDAEDPDWRDSADIAQWPKSQWLNLEGGQGFHGQRVVRVCRVGKSRAGRALDGLIHDEYPEPSRQLAGEIA